MRNLPLTFDYTTYSQKLGEDLAKFCGLLRIYELYYIREKLMRKLYEFFKVLQFQKRIVAAATI